MRHVVADADEGEGRGGNVDKKMIVKFEVFAIFPDETVRIAVTKYKTKAETLVKAVKDRGLEAFVTRNVVYECDCPEWSCEIKD